MNSVNPLVGLMFVSFVHLAVVLNLVNSINFVHHHHHHHHHPLQYHLNQYLPQKQNLQDPLKSLDPKDQGD